MVAMLSLQNTWGAGCSTSPDGFIVIVNVFESPVQVTPA